MAKKIILIIVIVGALCGAAGAYVYFSVKGNAVAAEGDIYLNEEADYGALVDSLNAGGHIESMKWFGLAADFYKLKDGVRPGHYRLQKGMSYAQLARMFGRGLQSPVRVTFNNIRLLPQLAGRVGGQIEPDSAAMARLLLADTTARHYGFKPQTFIAMFIPDTYEFYWTSTPRDFTDRMQKEYDRFWNDAREAKRAKLGLSRVEVSTLASIVYEETKMSDEMPTVAGVYINRLRRGMKLQADPTVKFAVGDFTLKRILYRHLEADSPYNTYMYEGLPPGPICMPSVKAIDAVLDYKRHDYLYFCAKPDFSGYHNFATTLAQHNRNRDAWVAALNKAGIR